MKRLINTLIQEKYCITVCAPLGLLATNYREEFYPELEADTIHALFHIPVADDQQYCFNYRVGTYDCVIIDEDSMVADETFDMIHDALDKQAHRPLVIIAGDERQQPPLKTINGRTVQTTSIIVNRRLRKVSQIHSLYQQFRSTDKAYLQFLEYIRYLKPAQYVLNNFQKPLLLFQNSEVSDYDIWDMVRAMPNATFLTVSRAAAACMNKIVIERLFGEHATFCHTFGKRPARLFPLKEHADCSNTKYRQTQWHRQWPRGNHLQQPGKYSPPPISQRSEDLYPSCYYSI